MLPHWVLVGLFAACAQAYAPIQWMKFPNRNLVLAPQGVRSALLVPPLSLTIMAAPRISGSVTTVPYFTVNPDKTITWDSTGWCVEAGGTDGDVIRVNHCTGGPAQKWDWTSSGKGRSMIHLKGTGKCLSTSAIDGVEAVPVVLQECERGKTDSWEFEGPMLLPTQNSSQQIASAFSMLHAIATVVAVLVLGSVSLGAGFWLWQKEVRALVARQGRVSLDHSGVCLSMLFEVHQRSIPSAQYHNVNTLGTLPATMVLSPLPAEDYGRSKACEQKAKDDEFIAIEGTSISECVHSTSSDGTTHIDQIWKAANVSSYEPLPKAPRVACNIKASVATVNSRTFELKAGIVDPVPTSMANTGPQIPTYLNARGPPRGECIKRDSADAAFKGQFEELPISDRPALRSLLGTATEGWEIDVLELAELSCNRPLSTIAEYLFHENHLVEFFGFDTQKLNMFLNDIENGYFLEVPYHNRAHAASVVHFMHFLLFKCGLAEAASGPLVMSVDKERSRLLVGMAGLIAACVHDYEHLGFNNDYLSRTKHERAVRYNDRHANENHHVSAAFEVLLRPDCNFLDVLPPEEFSRIRGLVSDLVLATDMSEHQNVVENFRTSMVASQTQPGKISAVPQCPGDAILSLQMALKCADLGYLALSWTTQLTWLKRLEAEFFAQGDAEKKIGLGPVSFLMDRDKPGLSTSQTVFFDAFALPLFSAFVSAFPSAIPVMSAVNANYARWTSIEAKAKPDEACRAAV